MRIIIGCALGLFASMSQAFCFNEAGARYHLDPQLLRSMAVVESALNAHAINENKRHGRVLSVDYGLMQINSTHIPNLKRLGIIKDKQELLTKPCLNVQIGAWLLAGHLQKCGVNWQCLGTYNTGFTHNIPGRMRYARKVYRVYLADKGA